MNLVQIFMHHLLYLNFSNNFITSVSRTGLQILTKNPLPWPRPEPVPPACLKSCSPARQEFYLRSNIACTILSEMANVAVFNRFSTSCVENAFSTMNTIVDTVSRTSLSLYKESILTVLHFKRDLSMSVHFSDFLEIM